MLGTNRPPEDEKSAGDIFLATLRQETAPQHKQLEDHPLSKTLMSSAITLEEYASYLACMKGVMERYDNEVLPFLRNIIPNDSIRRKLPWIENDLHYLLENKVSIPEVDKFYLPTLSSNSFAMGVAYVIEGSTLGGRVIIKNLQSHLPISETAGAQFFAGYGLQTGPLWKQFLESLIAFTLENKSQQEVIAGAQSCFSSIYNHFDKIKMFNEA